MKEVNAYLNFDGDCRKAMHFYQQSLGGELQISPFPDQTGKPSSDPAARVMHSQLQRNGQAILMASDTPPNGSLRVGNNVSVAIQCDSVAEIDRLFTALSQSGQVIMPLFDAPWGARFGMFTDQFGIQWLLNCFLSKPN